MKQLSDTENQELAAKIKDEQERQHGLQEMNPNTPKDSKWSLAVTGFTSSYLWKYGFLIFILCLLTFNAFILIRWWRFDGENNYIEHHGYVGLVIALMLLFNHIAYFLTTKGWKSVVMKTVAWVWIGFVFVYFFWILRILG